MLFKLRVKPLNLLALFVSLTLAQSISAQLINVDNVEALYAAVNDPANVGATIALAPGTYILTVNDPQDTPRPNRGRLDLQEDMSLIGVKGDRSAVVIDAFNLPASSYTGSPGPHAAVRLALRPCVSACRIPVPVRVPRPVRMRSA